MPPASCSKVHFFSFFRAKYSLPAAAAKIYRKQLKPAKRVLITLFSGPTADLITGLSLLVIDTEAVTIQDFQSTRTFKIYATRQSC